MAGEIDKILVGKTAVVNASTYDKVDVAGQISSRSVILLAPEDEIQNTPNYGAIGGLAGINLDNQVSAMPIYEMGSNKFVIPDSRPMPFRLSISKNFMNGRNILASIYRSRKANLKALNGRVTNFITDISRDQLRKPLNLMVAVQNIDNSASTTAKKLRNCWLESYGLSIDADRVVISEQASFVGEVVEDVAAAPAGVNTTFNKGGTGLANANDLDTFDNAGGITSMTVVLTAEIKSGSGGYTYLPIGGIRGMNISMQNMVTPHPEIGSKANIIVLGKPQPFMGSLQKVFINRDSLLQAITRTEDNAVGANPGTSTVRFLADVSTEAVSSPRNYAILIYIHKKGVETATLEHAIRLKQARITNYSFSSGDTVPLNEQCAMTGELIEEIM